MSHKVSLLDLLFWEFFFFLAAPHRACFLILTLFPIVSVYVFMLSCFVWFVEVDMCFCSKSHSSSHKHTQTYTPLCRLQSGISHHRKTENLEADQIRTRELDLINLVKLLMRLTAAGLSQRVSHSGICLIPHELDSQTDAGKLFNIGCVMNYVISSNQVMDKFVSFQITSIFECLGAAQVCNFGSNCAGYF